MAGAFSNCVIRFDSSPTGVFYSGQVISGSLLFDLDKPINISTIYMQFLGEADVLWIENEVEKVHGVKSNKVVKYVGHEEYFNVTMPLAGEPGPSKLRAGGQSIPFKFQIPFDAPSTFKGEQGEVSYSMTAHLVYAEPSQLREEFTKIFQVVAPFDLNLGSPRIRQPIDLEFEEVYGCGCFCGTSPVTIRVRLPISGYCPGQAIPVGVEVQNESSVEITKMIFELVSKEIYRSSHPPSEFILPEKILVTMKKGPVMAHCKRNFTCDVMVPEIIVPYLENCGIIDVGYFFRVTIKLSGCYDDIQDVAEICLGLIPVKEFIEGQYVHPLAYRLPSGPIPVPGPNNQLVPPVANDLRGSNHSLQKVQYNSDQTASYQNNRPAYPNENQRYSNGNRFETPVSMGQNNYEIGFKSTEKLPAVGMPYPGANTPYPGQNFMHGVASPYPTGNMMPQGNSGVSPYAQRGFTPSAPPPN